MRYLVLVLSLFVSLNTAFAADGFFGQVKVVENGGESLLVDGSIEGYGDRTSVVVGVAGVRDTAGNALPLSALNAGARIFVACSYGFLETTPLQLSGKAHVVLLGAAEDAGFEATVDRVHTYQGRLSLVVRANLPGYGDTQVSVGVAALVNTACQPVPAADVKPGARVFVEYDGGFLESYPLQLTKSVRVFVR